jgi:hypothetical protein
MKENNLNFSWKKLSITGPVPKARAGHAMSYGGGSKVILFGGGDSDDIFNDTWEYDTSTCLWKKLKIEGLIPSARLFHVMVYADNSKIVLFGGNDGNNWLNDTWEFDALTHKWNQYVTKATPEARKCYSMATGVDSKVILFGGRNLDEKKRVNLGDTWEYDVLTHEWTKWNITWRSPSARYNHVMAFADSKIILFGGSDKKEFTLYEKEYNLNLYDTWEYDVVSHSWENFKFETSPTYCGAMAYTGGSKSVLCNIVETWEYDSMTHEWIQFKKSIKKPSSRGHYAMSYGGGCKVILFGGDQGVDFNSCVKDTWELDIDNVSSKIIDPVFVAGEINYTEEQVKVKKEKSKISIKEAKDRIESAKKRDKLEKPIVKWLQEDKLPKLKWNTGEELDVDAIRFLFYRQKTQTEIMIDPEARDVYSLIDRKSGGAFARAVLDCVLKNDKISSKTRFALSVIGSLGDKLVIPTLEKIAIEDKNINAIDTIGLLCSLDAARALDKIMQAFRIKYPNVKSAAKESFDRIAGKMGMTTFELSDKMIPDFGFAGLCKKFKIGKEEYTVKIDKNMKLVYNDSENKALKILPKTTEKLKAELKEMGNHIREMVKQQKVNMENYLVIQRKWSKDDWETFFLCNPLAFAFAQNFVWAEYDKNKIKLTFSISEDLSIKDVKSKVVKLSGEKIGLVHPMDLCEAEKNEWNKYLSEKVIEPPFVQIERPVYIVADEEKEKTISYMFEDTTLNGLTFKSRAERLGWRRGSVVDSGEVSSYRKLYDEKHLEVFIKTKGLGVQSDIDNEVTLGEYYFVKLGSIVTGSYTYDEPRNEKDERLIKFVEVPKIIYSETINDLKKITRKKDEEE